MDTGQISPIAALAFAALGGGRLGGVGEARAGPSGVMVPQRERVSSICT
jgi:hypothetical protein